MDKLNAANECLKEARDNLLEDLGKEKSALVCPNTRPRPYRVGGYEYDKEQ